MPYYDSGVGNGPAQLIDGAAGRGKPSPSKTDVFSRHVHQQTQIPVYAGVSAKIRNAYSFLSHNDNFDKNQDEIYLVGFSRGAFLFSVLPRSCHLYHLRGLFSLWSEQEFNPRGRSGGEGPVLAELRKNKSDLKPLLHQVKIEACVAYDTSSYLGLTQLPPRPLAFVGRTVPGNVNYAFQALALDERRRKFKPLVWTPVEGSDTVPRQCWFLGGHGDVGGNGDAALGAVTLLWVIGLLRTETGVTFDDGEILKHLKHRLPEWGNNRVYLPTPQDRSQRPSGTGGFWASRAQRRASRKPFEPQPLR